MALAAGDKLGAYEILGPLGAGGMGEVYRARDSKLKRDVALKVLPDVFASDAERMARFQREAEVLASLNHTNIAQIYGVEDRALVMELVEGESPKGPMPFDDAWKIASQMAAGLEYAHEKGIVHRDLKPANIKITPDGVVKLLDFGLAKAFTGQTAASGNPENSPTLTLGATQLGVILGTAAYMAPEQAKGKSLDKRADIWSFGVVFYELLTGERPFSGDDVSETLAQVLTKRPDLEKLPEPARLLLRSCLERDPKERLRDIGDAKRLVEFSHPPASAGLARGTALRYLWPALAAGILAALAIGVLYFREMAKAPRVIQLAVVPPERTALPFNVVPAVSPDGRRVVFEARVDGKTALWVRDLSSQEAYRLPGTEGATLPFWSPDSRSLGFFAGGKLKKTDAAGGPVLTLCDASTSRGGSWSPSGIIIFSQGLLSPLFRVSATGGTPVQLTTLDQQERAHRYPWFLPDGRHFLYVSYRLGGLNKTLRVGDLQSSEKRDLLPVTSNVVYAWPGYLLFLKETTLMAQRFDAGKLRITGDAFPIADKLAYVAIDIRGSFSASQNGVLAYVSGRAVNSQLAWFDRTGKTIGTLGTPGATDRPVISPDGGSVATTQIDPRSGLSDLWLYNLARGTSSRLTFDSVSRYPVWSPDNQHLAYTSLAKGTGWVYQRSIGGIGREELLDEHSAALVSQDWSRDGRYILERATNDSATGTDIWVLPLFGDRKPFAYLRTPANETHPSLSPDGRFLSYASDESNRAEVYVQTFPVPGGKWQISANGGDYPVWSRDGKELFFISEDGKMMGVEIKAGPKFDAGLPRPLFDVRLAPATGFDVSKDGRFLINISAEERNATPINVIVGWPEEARK